MLFRYATARSPAEPPCKKSALAPVTLVAENKGPEGWSDAVLDIFLRDHLCDRDETA